METVYGRISEGAFQKKVLKWLNSLENNYVIKVIRANRAGVHDIICCHNGLFKSTEVKKESGKMSKLQEVHALQVHEAGGFSYCVRPSTFEDYKRQFMLDLG
jgi:hypothetical protein